MTKHTQIIRRLFPTNCLSEFENFKVLALNGLNIYPQLQQSNCSLLIIPIELITAWLTLNPLKLIHLEHNKSYISCHQTTVYAASQKTISKFKLSNHSDLGPFSLPFETNSNFWNKINKKSNPQMYFIPHDSIFLISCHETSLVQFYTEFFPCF